MENYAGKARDRGGGKREAVRAAGWRLSQRPRGLPAGGGRSGLHGRFSKPAGVGAAEGREGDGRGPGWSGRPLMRAAMLSRPSGPAGPLPSGLGEG